MDEAHTRLRTIDKQKKRTEQDADFVAYQQWLTGKRSVFKNTSDEMFGLRFNRVLGLDKSLLPDSCTTGGLTAIELSTLILEDALVTLVSTEAETELNNFSGCEHHH